tara:strand:+ start:249 stop:509 length:261 start_codon:yes stop_codon:yes gene_type:complete
MTKIYIYCLFDLNSFIGVYSSLKAVHRDALKLSNRGSSSVFMLSEGQMTKPSLTSLRNTLKGKCDVEVKYRTDTTSITIYKTKLKE